MLQTFSTLFKIRALQSFRIMKSIGIIRLLVFALCVVPFLIRYFSEAWYLLVVSSLFLALIHFLRTDKRFIKIMQLSVYQVYGFEYSLFLLPVWIFLLAQKEFLYAGLSIGFTILLSSIQLTINQQNRPILFVSRWISPIAFEWKSGFRQHFPFVAVLFLLGFGLSMYELAIPLIIVSFTLLTANFYLESEPLEMLKVFEKSPKQLLIHKILWQLKLFWFCMLPLLVVFMIFHYIYWYVILYLFVTSSIAQVFAIFYKYAVYQPHTQNQLNVFIYVVFSLAFMLVIATPFLVPVSAFIMIRYYKKSITNLDLYLYSISYR
jgi:hypothetical protein